MTRHSDERPHHKTTPSMRWAFAFLGMAAALGGTAAAGWQAGAADQSAGAADLDRGAEIYAEACAACHGPDLEGQPEWRRPGPDGRYPAPPHDATGHTWHHSDRVLLDIVMHGTSAVVGGGYESDMPGFADRYSEDELRAVLDWIKTHWPERERAYQDGVTQADSGRP